jgi:hypothetical protein
LDFFFDQKEVLVTGAIASSTSGTKPAFRFPESPNMMKTSGRQRIHLYLWLGLSLALGLAGTAAAQPPVPGSLCADVVPAGAEDFWLKWEMATVVVYGQPILSAYSTMGDVLVSPYEPDPMSETFEVRTLQVWKGPTSMAPTDVTTTWGFTLWDCGTPPGYCVYEPESCALVVEDGEPQVFFLVLEGDRYETYAAYGTGIYDLTWLETEVGEPVAAETGSWGSLKASYR